VAEIPATVKDKASWQDLRQLVESGQKLSMLEGDWLEACEADLLAGSRLNPARSRLLRDLCKKRLPEQVQRPAVRVHRDAGVMSQLAAEGLVGCVRGAVALGVPITVRTATRWALYGLRGVKLESVRVGRRRMTSIPALVRFFAATDSARNGKALESPPPASQALSPEAARRVLESHGLGRRSELPANPEEWEPLKDITGCEN
jgi:hypothetical protein